MRISDWSSDVCSSDLQATHHRPHLMMEEGTGGDVKQDGLALTPDIEPIQRLHRALRLAMRRADSRKVVQPRQALRRLVHRFGVEYHRHPPAPPTLQRQRRPPAYDALEEPPPHTPQPHPEIPSPHPPLHAPPRLHP